MTPLFEQVTIPAGHSWGLLWRELDTIAFLWHYHPQFELTL
ncbi:MAG: AraC family transcriptional regulator, partial [Janthinobacterium lividum]|nr:AraC family transcriptional regulator [Janthinobacterium lividum]